MINKTKQKQNDKQNKTKGWPSNQWQKEKTNWTSKMSVFTFAHNLGLLKPDGFLIWKRPFETTHVAPFMKNSGCSLLHWLWKFDKICCKKTPITVTFGQTATIVFKAHFERYISVLSGRVRSGWKERANSVKFNWKSISSRFFLIRCGNKSIFR